MDKQNINALKYALERKVIHLLKDFTYETDINVVEIETTSIIDESTGRRIMYNLEVKLEDTQ